MTSEPRIKEPAFSADALRDLLSPNQIRSPEELANEFAEYEADAALLFNETEVRGEPDLVRTYYAGYLIALLLSNELPEARFLTHRYPPSLRTSDPLLASTTQLLQSLWTHDHQATYSVIEDTEWPVELQPIVACVRDQFRSQQIDLLRRAYQNLPPTTAATHMGLTGREDEAIQELQSRGWTFDHGSKLLVPDSHPPTAPTAYSNLAKEDYSVKRLVDLVGRMGDSAQIA